MNYLPQFFALALSASLPFPAVASSAADRLLVEAESFSSHGGWSIDTQFIRFMVST